MVSEREYFELQELYRELRQDYTVSLNMRTKLEGRVRELEREIERLSRQGVEDEL